MNILWLSPDPFNAREMRSLLTRQGLRLFYVSSLDTAVEAVTQGGDYSLGIIELGSLPEDEFIAHCRRFVEVSPFPVVAIGTYESEEFQRAIFKAGAVDYVTQPYDLEVLAAQLVALSRWVWVSISEPSGLRREAAGKVAVGDDIVMDVVQRQLIVRGAVMSLTSTEFRLLLFLVRNAGQVLDRESIFNAVWGYDRDVGSREVDVYISYLRRKIEVDPGNPRSIVTHWGVGYEFVPQQGGEGS